MNTDRLEQLLRRIAATRSEEISCSDCFELLATGVELELAGNMDDPVWTRLAQHLGQCGVCHEEYEVLRDFVREESQPEG
jgi:hypothetical protein